MVKENNKLKYDVMVIGSGHAGCEAALAAARGGAKTLLVSINLDTVVLTPYGNEMGGAGRDLLIKEIDIMGGEILKNIKNNYISIRLDNKWTDYQVKTTKVLVDRRRYLLFMKKVIENQEKTTKSGIVLPDSVEKKEQTKGIVAAIGSGKFGQNGERLSMSVRVGDKVVFSKPWSDDKKMEENGKKFYLVGEDEILGIIEE